MDSRLDAIFRTGFLPPEAADTRQEIKRDEEKPEQRKKHDREEKGSDQDIWQDRTTISVRSLIVFLENLLAESDKKEAPSSAPAAQPEPPPGAATGRAAQAARAYQNTASHGSGAPPPVIKAPAGAGSAAPQLSAEEMRTIHALIADLKILQARAVEQVEIRRNDSFLQSLVDAVRSSL